MCKSGSSPRLLGISFKNPSKILCEVRASSSSLFAEKTFSRVSQKLPIHKLHHVIQIVSLSLIHKQDFRWDFLLAENFEYYQKLKVVVKVCTQKIEPCECETDFRVTVGVFENCVIWNSQWHLWVTKHENFCTWWKGLHSKTRKLEMGNGMMQWVNKMWSNFWDLISEASVIRAKKWPSSTTQVEAYPAAVSFQWFFNSSEYEEWKGHEEFSQTGLRSELEFLPKSSKDYGSLFCIGENAIGRQEEACVFQVNNWDF